MASIDCLLANDQGNSDNLTRIPIAKNSYETILHSIWAVSTLHSPFKCDFCPITFQTEDDFDAHVLEHFVKKNCSSCNKLLIRIGTQWYELHVDELKDESTDDHKEYLELDSILQINIEKLDEELEFNNSSDHDINFDNDVAGAPEISSDSKSEPPKKIRKRSIGMSAKSKKRKKSATQTDSPAKQDKSKTEEKPIQRRKRGGGPLPRVKCRICDRIILKYNFETHLQKMHVPNVIVTKDPVRCDTCGKSFANAGNLKIHQTIHSGTRRFGMNSFTHFSCYFDGFFYINFVFHLQFAAIVALASDNFITCPSI